MRTRTIGLRLPKRTGAKAALAAMFAGMYLTACAVSNEAVAVEDNGIVESIVMNHRDARGGGLPVNSIAPAAPLSGAFSSAGTAAPDPADVSAASQPAYADALYRVTVRYDDGVASIVVQDASVPIRLGDRVSVVAGRIVAR